VRLALAMLLAVGAMTSVAIAQVGDTTIVGGPGGGNFRDQCPDNYALYGVNFTSGKDVNSIGTVCIQYDGGVLVGDPVGQRTFGQPVDHAGSAWCPPHTVVEAVQVDVSGANVLHNIHFNCRDLITHSYHMSTGVTTNGGGTARSDGTGCGGGAIAIGVIGRYGSMVDAIGLICRVVNRPPPPPPLGTKPVKKTGKAAPPDAGPLVNNNPVGVNTPGNGGGGGGDQATAPGGTTIYRQPNGDESDGNIAGYVDPGGTVTVISCNGGFCHVGSPADGYVWHEDIGR